MARKRLFENFILGPKSFKKIDTLQEDKKRILYKGKQYLCVAAYTVPISRPGIENLNGRIYSLALWQNVINNQSKIWEGSVGLCDHPKESDDGGSVKDIFCVWHNLRFNKERTLVLADMYLASEWGEHAQKVIEAGGSIGLSTSGFGDFEADKKTVDADTYEIERPSDWVLNPSYEVYGSLEDEIQGMDTQEEQHIDDNMTNRIEESEQVDDEFASDLIISKVEISKLSTNSSTNKVIEKSREKNSMAETLNENRISLLEQKNLKYRLKEMFSVAENTESLTEKVGKYQEILDYCDGIDSVDFVKEKVTEATSKLKSLNEQVVALAEKGKSVDVLQEQAATHEKQANELQEQALIQTHDFQILSEEHNQALELLDDMRVYTKKLKEMYTISQAEKNGMVTAKDHKEALMYVNTLEEELEELKAENIKLRKRIRKLKKYQEEGEEVASEVKSDSGGSFEDSDVGDFDDASDYNSDGDAQNDISDQRPTHVGPGPSTPGSSTHESYFGDRNREVEAYYEDLIEENPNVKRIEEQILRCRTLLEAERLYMNLEDLLNSPSPNKKRTSRKVERVTEDVTNRYADEYEPSMDRMYKSHPGWV